MGWEGEEGEELLAPLPPLDPYPFTREGRLYRRIEHELSLTQAVLKVGALVLERQRVEAAKRRARKGRRGTIHPV
jgi:hypothetical protein